MSVSIKLADEDAVVIGRILKAVTEPVMKSEDLDKWRTEIGRAMSSSTLEHIKELSGAFKVAARANER